MTAQQSIAPGTYERTRITARSLDPATLSGFVVFNGVKVTKTGEDGHLMLLGHHDEALVWKVFLEAYEDFNGSTYEEDFGDGIHPSQTHDITACQVTFSDHHDDCELLGCTCYADQVCDKCRDGNHEACDRDCLCLFDYDHDKPATWPCGCECSCDEYEWWFNHTTTNGEPVTLIAFSYEKTRALPAKPDQRATPGERAR